MSTHKVKPGTMKNIPLILSKNIIYNNRKLKLVKSIPTSVKEDIIYTSKPGDFMSGEVRKMTLVNRFTVGTNTRKTIARCQSHSGQLFEKTSDEVTKLIGQENYDFLFSCICSIISEELKIRSINSLLTVPRKSSSVSCQTELNPTSFSKLKNIVDAACQTMETGSQEPIYIASAPIPTKYTRPRKRNKRQNLQPYVVKDEPEVKQPRRRIISPDEFNTLFVKTEKDESVTSESSLPIVVGKIFSDEDSNGSVGQWLSSTSMGGTPDLVNDHVLKNIDKHTQDISSEVKQSEIEARQPVFDCPLHEKLSLVKEEQLKSPEDRIKMLLRQGLSDFKNCLQRDAEGHLPIHVAVLTNDVDLLKRQGLALKLRGFTVDEPADGLTPLRMSLVQENTQLICTLLHYGADILDSDEDDKTAFHIAAEKSTDHLRILINYCQENARKILLENELWRLDYEKKSDEELAKILLIYINKLYDNQGYTPVMIASKLGKYNNVMALLENCQAAVNLKMPNSGETALYLAVGHACIDAGERGNKAKIVDHFSKTIEILVENGADPGIANFSGSSVNDLLTEFNIAELSMLIANKLTSFKYFDGNLPSDYKGSDYMLVKDEQGQVNLKDMKQEKGRKYYTNTAPKNSPNNDPAPKTPPTKSSNTKSTFTKTKSSPIITENIEYKPPKKSDIITLPGNLQKCPTIVNVGKVDSYLKQNDSKTFTPTIQTTLSKPIILKTTLQNNKRKLDIIVEPTQIKKINKND